MGHIQHRGICVTPAPHQALTEQARAIRDHDRARAELVNIRNGTIRQLAVDGHPITGIARAAQLSRETIYQILKDTP